MASSAISDFSCPATTTLVCSSFFFLNDKLINKSLDYKVKTVEQQPANISLYHHFTPVNTSTFVNHFRRHVPLGKYITVLRDPMARSLSEYYYFWQPDAPKTPLYDLLTNKTVNLLGRMHYMHRDMVRKQQVTLVNTLNGCQTGHQQ